MGSSIASLNELTVIAVDDYLLVHDTSDLLDQDKRISQTNLMASYSARSGTPTAGRVASWITPTTIGDSGVAVSQLAQKTGTPVANNLASWNDANTVKDGGIAVANIPQKSGTLVAGNNAHWSNTTGTLIDSGFAASAIARKSGAITPGNNAHWLDANTLVDSGFVAADIVRKVAGTPTPGNVTLWSAAANTIQDSSMAFGDVARLSVAQTFSALKTFGAGANFGQANNLTYFDQGAWPVAPQIQATGTNPTVTYTIQDHYFMRLGNVVFFSFYLAINAISGGSGNIQIGPLPFTCSALNQPRAFASIDGVAIPGTAPFAVVMSAINSTNTMRVIATQNNATFSNIAISLFGAGDSITGSGFFLV
jgi:hypothetical protein